MAGPEAPASGRRRLVEFLLGGGLLASALSFLYPIQRYLIPPAATDLGSDTVVAGRVGELKRNTGKIFRFGNRPALLVLTADGEYRAMSATCTHHRADGLRSSQLDRVRSQPGKEVDGEAGSSHRREDFGLVLFSRWPQ